MKKIVLVTGAARGIGRGIVEELFKNKDNIIIANYNKSEEKAKELEEMGIQTYRADVTNKLEVKEMINYILNKYGKIDVLINNAGISQIKMFNDITEEEWDNMIKSNLTSVFYTTQAVIQNMIQNKKRVYHKHFINMGNCWRFLRESLFCCKGRNDRIIKSISKRNGTM